MQLQGASQTATEALRAKDIEAAGLDASETRLLEFVKLLTLHAYRTTPETIQGLRDVGWSDEQIAEAVYITGYFAFFNRVADAFGLTDPMAEEQQ